MYIYINIEYTHNIVTEYSMSQNKEPFDPVISYQKGIWSELVRS